jgi:hypothetical protein
MISRWQFWRLTFSVALALLLAHQANSQDSPADDPPGRWQFETITLRDQTKLSGLVQAIGETEIDFAQIVQPPGRPMYAVIRGIPRSEVQQIERLDEAARLRLFERLATFRNRAVIEAGRLSELKLTAHSDGGRQTRHYEGPWFTLVSTADDEQTRRCLVRIEQLFRAYRTLLPPRANQQPLAVRLYGSLDEYRSRLEELSLGIDNAAFYVPRERTILAASELGVFARRLAQVRREHEQIRKDLAKLDTAHPLRMSAVADELKAAGFSPDEIAAELRQRRAGWKKELETTLAANLQRERSAERKFDDVTAAMFRSLAHESFHAWVDAFVFPHDRHDVPRWLNEGLAQVFECGQLDGESLRLDAPDKQRLRALQADLKTAAPLSLAQVLTARERQFLGPHAGGSPQRHYLYAWGLAWYLTFEGNLLASERLNEYVANSAQEIDPIARFERLTGRPLAEFETAWRTAMLELR